MIFDVVIGKQKWRSFIMATALFCIWMVRDPLVRLIYCDDIQITNQLHANLAQKDNKDNEFLADFKNRSYSFRRIGTII